MRTPVTAYLGLGANLGDAQATVHRALQSLEASDGITANARSSLYRTAPVESSGPDYINAVVEVSTILSAPQLLVCLQGIENAAGRQRPYHNAPRTLDLDILIYGSARMDSLLLTIPHPRMWQRAFVLVPLAEIAPQRVGVQHLQGVQGQAIERLR